MTDTIMVLQRSAESDIAHIVEFPVLPSGGRECPRHGDEPTLISKRGRGGPRPNSGGRRSGAGRKPKPIPAIPVETTRWYCIRTAPQAESNVNESAVDAGFETFFPRLWVAPVTARRTATGRAVPAKPERLVPLFPRYLFARFNRETDPWRRLASIRGVDCVFGSSPERPTPVPDGAIETIRGQCRDDVVYPDGIAPTSQPAVKRRWTSFMSALQTMMEGG